MPRFQSSILFLFFLASLFVVVSACQNLITKPKNPILAKSSLKSIPSIIPPYPPIANSSVKSYGTKTNSFGIYSKNANYVLKRDTSHYSFFFHLNNDIGGEWVSIRKEFSQPINLSQCNGLDLKVKVIQPSTYANLRVTLCDLNLLKNRDEMFWYDIDSEFLRDSSDWVSFKIKFSDFDLAKSEGTRKDDLHLDLSNIIAYEINVLSPNRDTTIGTFLFFEPVVF